MSDASKPMKVVVRRGSSLERSLNLIVQAQSGDVKAIQRVEKAARFAELYGAGPQGLRRLLGLPPEEKP